MTISVRPAQNNESSFAWPLYGALIAQYIYPVSASKKDKTNWLSDEETKFQKAWPGINPLIIEDNGKSVGWASIQRCNNRVTVHNIFVIGGYSLPDIGGQVLRDMLPEWQTGKRFVEVPVLNSGPERDRIIRVLEGMGFSASLDDGLVTIMTADWSKPGRMP